MKEFAHKGMRKNRGGGVKEFAHKGMRKNRGGGGVKEFAHKGMRENSGGVLIHLIASLILLPLTHSYQETCKRVICKQCRPRSDAT